MRSPRRSRDSTAFLRIEIFFPVRRHLSMSTVLFRMRRRWFHSVSGISGSARGLDGLTHCVPSRYSHAQHYGRDCDGELILARPPGRLHAIMKKVTPAAPVPGNRGTGLDPGTTEGGQDHVSTIQINSRIRMNSLPKRAFRSPIIATLPLTREEGPENHSISTGMDDTRGTYSVVPGVSGEESASTSYTKVGIEIPGNLFHNSSIGHATRQVGGRQLGRFCREGDVTQSLNKQPGSFFPALPVTPPPGLAP